MKGKRPSRWLSQCHKAGLRTKCYDYPSDIPYIPQGSWRSRTQPVTEAGRGATVREWRASKKGWWRGSGQGVSTARGNMRTWETARRESGRGLWKSFWILSPSKPLSTCHILLPMLATSLPTALAQPQRVSCRGIGLEAHHYSII